MGGKESAFCRTPAGLILGDTGDFFDHLANLFGMTGFVALFELIPGVDIIPTFTVTWLLWYSFKRRKAQIKIDEKLEEWK